MNDFFRKSKTEKPNYDDDEARKKPKFNQIESIFNNNLCEI